MRLNLTKTPGEINAETAAGEIAAARAKAEFQALRDATPAQIDAWVDNNLGDLSTAAQRQALIRAVKLMLLAVKIFLKWRA